VHTHGRGRLDLRLDALSLGEVVLRVEALIASGEGGLHLSLNAAKVELLRRDRFLAGFAERSAIVTADGAGVVLAARAAGRPLPGRVTGVDLMAALVARASVRRWPVFLVGGRPDVLEEAVAELRMLHPGLILAGAHHGYMDEESEARLGAQIAATAPRLLVVGMGTPRQEKFLERWTVPGCYGIGVGGGLDVLAGRIRRAPRALRLAGLEWAWRTMLEPHRLVSRRTLDTARFMWRSFMTVS
jgi:N-acetylglucosaminyldiphosphoundecaprenol N-acetyl-beta-D-mannosaminyltransferase